MRIEVDDARRKIVLRSFITVWCTAWLTVRRYNSSHLLKMWKQDVRQFYSVLTCSRGDHLLCYAHNISLSLYPVQWYIIVQLYSICRRRYTCTLWYPGTGFMAWSSVHCLPGLKETVDMKRSPPPPSPPPPSSYYCLPPYSQDLLICAE